MSAFVKIFERRPTGAWKRSSSAGVRKSSQEQTSVSARTGSHVRRAPRLATS